jgi:DNA invertase Pin-like site-specific DNA recombinase
MEPRRKVLRVALYGRVSTVDKGQDVNLQIDELRSHAGQRDWDITGIYCDIGVSGSKEIRPQFQRLMADAKQRRFDAVLVWKLDRFGRSLKHLVNALSDLDDFGVRFVSLHDGFDLTTAQGRLLFQIVGAMCEFERNLIRERVRAGMARAKAKGHTIGRTRKCVDILAVQARRSAGESLRSIARDLGVSPALLVQRIKSFPAK